MEEKETHIPIIKRIPWLSVAGIALGALGGYIYYIRIGCNSGSCPITSNPWMSMLWGAAIGYLLFDMFSGKKKKRMQREDRRSEIADQ
ncbi:MAG: hypothetical protein KKA81_07735 [Bacteroidetes bacterium]|nr:hypothetical protein [Bacteroidota bacterium]